MWIINKMRIKYLHFILPALFCLSLLIFPLFSANLNIKDDLITDILGLIPQNSTPACSSSCKGKLYYNSNDKQIYYCDGTTWQVLGAGGKDTTIGSAIVASSSADPLRADFACDGTDDQIEIQEAIDYLNNTGGAVYLLEGTYNLSNKITFNNGTSDGIDDSNKALIGTGAGTVLNLTTHAIQTSDVSRITLSQLRIKYNVSDSWFENISYSLLEKLWLEGIEEMIGMLIGKSNFNTITKNFFILGDASLWLLNNEKGISGSSYNIIYNNIFTSIEGEIGILYGSSNNIAIGNMLKESGIEEKRQAKILISKGSSYNIVVGNRIFDVRTGIVSERFSTDNIFTSNIISGFSVFSSKGIHLYDGVDRQLISSNFISDFGGGIEVEEVHNSLLVGNILYNNPNPSILEGIGVGVKADNNLISSNHIYASTCSGYGIAIKSSSDNNYLVGNFIGESSYSQPIDDVGSNTRYTDKIKISLEPGTYTGLKNGKTLTPQGPTSYLRLDPSSNINLGDPNIVQGKTEGDILIIENAASDNYYVRFKDGQGVELEDSILTGKNLDLYPGDVLVLVWYEDKDGINSRWIEIGYSDN